MSRAVHKLDQYIDSMPEKKLRLLTISDGSLHDQQETLSAASKLANKIKGNYMINSQAIRLFTSYSEPDTRGLASILQLNSTCTTYLKDINAHMSDIQIVNEIKDLFETILENLIAISSSIASKDNTYGKQILEQVINSLLDNPKLQSCKNVRDLESLYPAEYWIEFTPEILTALSKTVGLRVLASQRLIWND